MPAKSYRKLTLLLIVLIIGVFICYNWYYQTQEVYSPLVSGQLQIHFIDVGQADCILVQAPNGNNMLIDAGNNNDFSIISSYLNSHHVRQLNVVVATHPHEDHIGSMAAVVRDFKIGRIFMSRVSTNTRTFEDLLTAIKEKGLTVNTSKAGVTIDLDPTIKTEMLAPNRDQYDNLNDYSAVIKLTYGKNIFLFTGDASRVSEKEMLKKGYSLAADVLKVGHHGSNTSTTGNFLKAVAPKYAVISVGAHNDYGHPGKYTAGRLMKTGMRVYRTDLNGTVSIISDGNELSIKTQR